MNGGRFSNPADLYLCGWGRCGARVADHEPLCRRHMLDAWNRVEMERRASGKSHLEFITEVRTPNRPQAVVKPVDRPERVYYARLGNGDIKIGYTADLKQRMGTMRLTLDDVMASEPGGRDLEKMRHAQFEHLRRIKGREDFEPSEDLLSHIRMIHDTFVDFDPSPRWRTDEEVAELDALIDEYDTRYGG